MYESEPRSHGRVLSRKQREGRQKGKLDQKMPSTFQLALALKTVFFRNFESFWGEDAFAVSGLKGSIFTVSFTKEHALF